jgi:DNA-binding transcriptional LysR family regulator
VQKGTIRLGGTGDDNPEALENAGGTMILNERILRLIVTLAEELHFGRAAATLHVSQSALSGTVKSLEDDLGVRLFSRTSRNVELTAAGRVFVAEAGRLITQNERIVALVRQSSSDGSGPLHIGYPASSMNLPWLSVLISQARRDGFLSTELRFISSETINLHEDLAKGKLQAAFFTGQFCDADGPDLRSVKLFRDTLAVVLGSGHPLAQAASFPLDQLKDEPVVWLRRDVNPHLHDSFMALCAAQGYRPKVAQEVRTFYECLFFARQGLGITFLPPFMKSAGPDDTVVFLCLPEGTLHVEYTLAYCGNDDSRGIDQFVKFVQDHVPGTICETRGPGSGGRLIGAAAKPSKRND